MPVLYYYLWKIHMKFVILTIWGLLFTSINYCLPAWPWIALLTWNRQQAQPCRPSSKPFTPLTLTRTPPMGVPPRWQKGELLRKRDSGEDCSPIEEDQWESKMSSFLPPFLPSLFSYPSTDFKCTVYIIWVTKIISVLSRHIQTHSCHLINIKVTYIKGLQN